MGKPVAPVRAPPCVLSAAGKPAKHVRPDAISKALTNMKRSKSVWLLIWNGPNTGHEFATQRELRAFASEKNLIIHKSPMSDRCFYVL